MSFSASRFPPTKFLTSAWQPAQFPPDTGAEVAFAGRSNAGKSSALNAIVGRKDLARTSKTPGRTQLINFFELEGRAQRLADLPGYGYAKVPEQMKRHWQELLRRYVEARASLAGLVIVMDARRPLTEFDCMMIDWAQAHALDTHLLLTKSDKLSRSQASSTLAQVLARLEGRIGAQLFSAVKKTGVESARGEILRMLAARASGNRQPVGEREKKPR